MITVFSYPHCTQCQKVKAWLSEKNISFTDRNTREIPYNEQEISLLFSLCNDYHTLISKKTTLNADLYQKLSTQSKEELLQTMVTAPIYMQRPIVFHSDKQAFTIGYNELELIQLMS